LCRPPARSTLFPYTTLFRSMDRLHVDEDTPLESRMVSRQIESAQSRVEGHNFDSRRHVVEYDDVMNKQREIIYGERRKILEGTRSEEHTSELQSPCNLVCRL